MSMDKRRINVGRMPKNVQEPVPSLDLSDIEIVMNYVAFVTALDADKPDHFTVQHRGIVSEQFMCSFNNLMAKEHALIFYINHNKCRETVAPGCDRLAYIGRPFDGEKHNMQKTAWSATFRRQGGGLIDVFYRCHTLVPDHPVFAALGNLITMASRSITKCRFTGYDYFIPYPQFLYIGDAYR